MEFEFRLAGYLVKRSVEQSEAFLLVEDSLKNDANKHDDSCREERSHYAGRVHSDPPPAALEAAAAPEMAATEAACCAWIRVSMVVYKLVSTMDECSILSAT